MYWHHDPHFFWLAPLLWVAVIAVVGSFWARRGFRSRARWATGPAPRGATELLAERFARGEIDEIEYQDRLTTLRSHQEDAERFGRR